MIIGRPKDSEQSKLWWLGDNSTQATNRTKFQKAIFVPSGSLSHFEKVTIRPICKKRQSVQNCLVDQLINNLLKVETNSSKSGND